MKVIYSDDFMGDKGRRETLGTSLEVVSQLWLTRTSMQVSALFFLGRTSAHVVGSMETIVEYIAHAHFRYETATFTQTKKVYFFGLVTISNLIYLCLSE